MNSQHLGNTKRVLFFDQIKALMIALVIVFHVALELRWTLLGVLIPNGGSPHPLFDAVVENWLVITLNTFFMCMLFLLSGYFVPRSVHKKGIARYLKDRLLRIGVPFLFGLLLINPASVLLARLSPDSPWGNLAWSELPFNRLGVLWFLVVLFAFDLFYCAWIRLRGDHFAIDTSFPTPKQRSWLISAVVLAMIELVMAMQTDLWAALSRSPFDGLASQGMHIFTYAFLFFLGCKASFHRWLERLDAHLVVRWFRFSVVLALSLLAITIVLAFGGGGNVAHAREISFLMTLLNPFIGWGVMAYLLLWFQRHGQRCGPWLATAGIDSFGAYIIHPLVLVLVLEAIGFIGLNHWLIFLAASALGIVISFGLIHQLRRIPAVAMVI
ncbi:MAG: acyltransferase [Synechococcus sp. NP17]|nr:acyltransferase [Synechococcus sp. NP17]